MSARQSRTSRIVSRFEAEQDEAIGPAIARNPLWDMIPESPAPIPPARHRNDPRVRGANPLTALLTAIREQDSPEKQDGRRKVAARRMLRAAVESGKINKPDHCEECGELTASPHLDGHHEDYSRPLDVRWLCEDCHRKAHASPVPAA